MLYFNSTNGLLTCRNARISTARPRCSSLNCESNADLPKAVIPPQKPGQVKIWKPMTTENFN